MTTQELSAVVKRNPISFGCAALSVAFAVALYFRSDKIPAAEEELVQKSAEAERIGLNIKYSTQLKEQLEAVVAANKAIDARIVRASQLGTNSQFFYKLESDTGVKLIDNRQTSPANAAKPAKGAFIPVAFTVSVQGNMTQILEFLRQLENGAHYCRILTASCTGNTTTRSAPLTLGLNLELLGQP